MVSARPWPPSPLDPPLRKVSKSNLSFKPDLKRQPGWRTTFIYAPREMSNRVSEPGSKRKKGEPRYSAYTTSSEKKTMSIRIGVFVNLQTWQYWQKYLHREEQNNFSKKRLSVAGIEPGTFYDPLLCLPD